MSKSSDETAFPHRDTAIITEFGAGDEELKRYNEFTSILVNKHYKDKTELQGYYNYMNPTGNPNWRKYYFGDNYKRLSKIKAKYDPLNTFGNPMQVEPEPDSSSNEDDATFVTSIMQWFQWK